MKSHNYKFSVSGMHCAACELLIEKKVKKHDGVISADASLSANTLSVKSSKELSSRELSQIVQGDGYQITDTAQTQSINLTEMISALCIAAIFVVGFWLLQKAGVVNLINSDKLSIPVIFFIGVIASLSSCMAVVGGLVLSISSSYAKENTSRPLIVFHISRLISFFVFGGIIGAIGSTIILSSQMLFILNFVLFVAMFVMAANLIGITTFNSFQLRMPKWAGQGVLDLSTGNSPLLPVTLGALTFILPCGFTQSMQLYSLTTGSFVSGAITMLTFALGTLPVLASISFASVKFGNTLKSGLFFKTAGFIVLFFAFFNLINALVAAGLIAPVFNW